MLTAMQIGYALSSEEHPPHALVEHAGRAEEAGFRFALVSDHFHPWLDRQGNSPFHVYVHQVGPDQEGFFRFYQREVLPRLS